MRYLLSTASTNVDLNPLPLACIDIDDEALRTIAARRKLLLDAKDRDDELDEMYFWDWRIDFYDEDADFDPAIVAGMTGEDTKFSEVPDDSELPGIAASEGEHMIIRVDGVAWAAFPKNSGEFITTAAIPYDVIFKGQL